MCSSDLLRSPHGIEVGGDRRCFELGQHRVARLVNESYRHIWVTDCKIAHSVEIGKVFVYPGVRTSRTSTGGVLDSAVCECRHVIG